MENQERTPIMGSWFGLENLRKGKRNQTLKITLDGRGASNQKR